ncbi:hypothetical protein Celaphus_00013089, partial [Cervus elaphus hippelaphus]
VFMIKASGEVFMNQVYIQLPVSAANVTLFRPSTFFIIAQTQLGLQLDIQLVPIMQVFVRLEPQIRGQTCGLCGNFNQNQADDFRTISGVVEGSAAAFANTWKTQAACPNIKNSFEDPCSLSVENEKFAQHWCSRLTDPQGPFAQCHSTVDPSAYYSVTPPPGSAPGPGPLSGSQGPGQQCLGQAGLPGSVPASTHSLTHSLTHSFI